jgi:hypothetical protein
MHYLGCIVFCSFESHGFITYTRECQIMLADRVIHAPHWQEHDCCLRLLPAAQHSGLWLGVQYMNEPPVE